MQARRGQSWVGSWFPCDLFPWSVKCRPQWCPSTGFTKNPVWQLLSRPLALGDALCPLVLLLPEGPLSSCHPTSLSLPLPALG